MTPSRQSNSDGGWSFLGGQARKAHYFPSAEPGTHALCGKWMLWTEHPLEPDNGQASSEDCAGCRRKLDAARAEG